MGDLQNARDRIETVDSYCETNRNTFCGVWAIAAADSATLINNMPPSLARRFMVPYLS